MITKNDLEAAISECQNRKNPDARTCIMLAAFLTIKRELFEEENGYSFAPARNTIQLNSNTEFAEAINGRETKDVMPLMDELMTTVEIIQPRLYRAVMERLF